jgi:hypothetical protein
MTSRAVVVLANSSVRNALLSVNGLSTSLPDGPLPAVTATSGPKWVHQALLRLAHVQVDSIAAVERSHHHILFTRNHRYRQSHLSRPPPSRHSTDEHARCQRRAGRLLHFGYRRAVETAFCAGK